MEHFCALFHHEHHLTGYNTSDVDLFSLTVPPSQPESPVGLVGVGALADVHEASLLWHEKGAPSNPKEVLELSSTLQYPYAQTEGEYPRNSPTWNLLPALSGEWLAARLLNDQNLMCGAVYWHKDSVGSTTPSVAKRIRRDICVEGKAGMYNDRQESPEYLAKGGRIVGRMAWDDKLRRPLNDALPNDAPEKMNELVLQEILTLGWGPLFALSPVAPYFEETWPLIQENPAAALGNDNSATCEQEEGETQTCSMKPRMWAVGEALYTFLAQQEYLAGRILTKSIVLDDSQESNYMAAYLILIFTYSCPEQIGDASVEGTPILDPIAIHLKTTESFLSFVLDETTDSELLHEAFSEVSGAKILDLLEWGSKRNWETPLDDRKKVIEKIMPVIYAWDGGPLPYAPDLRVFHDQILVYLMDFEILDVFLSSLPVEALSNMVEAKKLHYCSKESYSTTPLPNTLLALASNVNTAETLVRAGMEPSLQAAVAALDRPDVFFYLLHQLKESISSEEDRAQLYAQMAITAALGLHDLVLSKLLDSIEEANFLLDFDLKLLMSMPLGSAKEVTLGMAILGSLIREAFFHRQMRRPKRMALDKDSCQRVMKVFETHFGIRDASWYENPEQYWVQLKERHVGYLNDREEALEELKGFAADVMGSYDPALIQTSSTGRLEEDLQQEAKERQEKDDDGSAASFHSPTVSRYWFLKAAQNGGNVV